MKRLLLVLALAIVLALALAVPAFAANPVLTFGYEPVGAVPWSAPVEGGKLAQSFTAEVGGRLAAADIYLTTQSFDTGSLYAELYDIAEIYGSTSVPTGNPLAVSTSVAANGPSGFTTFSFSGSDFILEEGHQYALVLREEVFSQAAGWGDSVETGDPAYSGNMSVDTGSGWSPADGYDFYFRVHVAKPAAEYEPVGAVPWSAPVEGGKLAQSFTAEVGGRLAAADIYLTTQSFDTRHPCMPSCTTSPRSTDPRAFPRGTRSRSRRLSQRMVPRGSPPSASADPTSSLRRGISMPSCSGRKSSPRRRGGATV